MNAPISISAAAPKVATARKMSAGDKERIVASQFAKPRGPIVNSYAQEMFRSECPARGAEGTELATAKREVVLLQIRENDAIDPKGTSAS